VRSAERATVLSVQSLVLQVTGSAGAITAGALTARHGAWAGFGIAAGALAAAAYLLARAPVGCGDSFSAPGMRRGVRG
jgi:hypothetical protein